ncbi:Usually multiple acids move in and out Transporters 21 [Hibiscus trionum]|uniref:WAT1-related protein n=1 Tax=Hibiscus trionum TaxID=183268 RepID=A0A9W7J1C0_HIBTR|nr:Usually multiple acids move in and out Transporters 21 [Hibiscus trionum]
MAMEARNNWLGWSQMVASMLAVQLFATGQQLLSKVILNQGAFIFSFMAYRHLVAALCVAPFAFFLERVDSKKLAWSTWFWLFINALTGITMAMGLFYYGLRDTTATYSTNFLNVIPIVTFVFSILLRMEKLGLGSRAGKIKTVGTIICVGGALTTSLYKGKAFYLGHDHRHFHSPAAAAAMMVSSSHWTRGTFMLVGSCLCYAIWYILQVKLLQVFPSRYRATLITCIMASVQSAAIGLCLDRREAAWRIEWNLQLVTIVYSGALSTAATFCLLTWAIAKRGPTYAPMFNPLSLIFVAISEALLLGEPMRLGIVVGTVMIIVGLYSFLWGRRKETELLGGDANAGDEELSKPVPGSEEMQLKTFETSPVSVKSVYAAMEEGALKDIVKS